VPRVNSITGGLIAVALSLPAQAGEWKDCRANEPAKALAGCSALIEQGNLAGAQLGEAYGRRAMAWRLTGQIDKGLADAERSTNREARSRPVRL
jgi:hypothetical protein